MPNPKAGFLSFHLVSAGILTLLAPGAMAAGFALIEQSASQMGNAFAGSAAIANDASTIYFNPAGMTRLPRQLVGGLHLVATQAEFSGSATTPAATPVTTGGDGGDAGGLGVVPNLYYTLPVNNRIVLGLGVNAPFGLATEYDDDWVGRYQAIKSEVVTININPAIAFKASNTLSVGIGVNFQYIEAELTQAIDQGSLCTPILAQLQAAGAPGADPANCAGLVPEGADGFAKVGGNNWAGGFNFGVLYEPGNSTRVGVSYRSRIKQQLIGDGEFSGTIAQLSPFGIFVDTDISASISLPQTASLSAYHDLNNQWSIMADATWTGWSSFDELRIEYDSNQPDTVVDESWNDSMRYALGVDYRHNNQWTFRGGIAFDESPIPNDEHRTARIPGEDRTWVSLGFGYQMSQTFAIDVGYSHLFIKEPNVDHGTATTGTIAGEYDASVDILSAQLVWNI
jgi:long-chain fatty acid transport protein